MNFQYITKMHSIDDLLELAFGSAKKAGEATWLKFKKANKVSRTRAAEKDRMKEVKKRIVKNLERGYDQYPIIDKLDLANKELVLNNIDMDKYKMAISSLRWTKNKIETIYIQSIKALEDIQEPKDMTKLRNVFYARVDSLLRKSGKSIQNLETIRKTLRRLPDIKDEFETVAIAGFPNVGKSSLLKALTGSNPEIANYAFTTKGLNVSYAKREEKEIQMIDVPGTFDRKTEDMNFVEKNAMIIIEHVADKLIFVLDASEFSGYTIEEQKGLLKRLQKVFKKEIIIAISKIDLIEKDVLEKVKTDKDLGKDITLISNNTGEGIKDIEAKLF